MMIRDGKVITPYFGDFKPRERRYNGYKIAGWELAENSGESVELSDTYNDKFHSVILEGNTAQNVTVKGKNLFDKHLTAHRTVGTTITELSTGIRTELSTFGSPHYAVMRIVPVKHVAGLSVTLSLNIAMSNPLGGRGAQLCVWKADGSAVVAYLGAVLTSSGSATVAISSSYAESDDYLGIVLWSSRAPGTGGENLPNQTIDYTDIQVELGSTATTYTPFVPDAPTPNYPSALISAGSCNLVVKNAANSESETIPISISLNKIGSVCDTYDIVTGEHIQRIGIATLASGTTWSLPLAKPNTTIMSDRLPNTTTLSGTTLTSAVSIPSSFTVMYELVTPVTTSLTPVDIPTYPLYTALETDSTVKPNISATAKVPD